MPKLNKNKNNDYISNPKENCIETPKGICDCLFDNLKNKINRDTEIIDIGCSRGNLSRRFYEYGYDVTGIDSENYKKEFSGKFIHKDFFTMGEDFGKKDKLILCNPVWNNPKKLSNLTKEDLKETIKINISFKEVGENIVWKDTRKKLISKMDRLGFSGDDIEKYIGKKYKWNDMTYFPEMFMKHIFEVFGENTKVVLLTIYGFLMNNGINSKRYKWLRDSNFKLSSVLEVPKDSFKDQGVDIWNHILFFNIDGLQPIWFLEDKYLDNLIAK